LTSITIGFNEALDPASVENPNLYSAFGGVKHRRKTVYTKPVRIRGISYNGSSRLTINLAKPHKGSLEVVVHAGILAANGTALGHSFSAVV
jgi:hypothetical protein